MYEMMPCDTAAGWYLQETEVRERRENANRKIRDDVGRVVAETQRQLSIACHVGLQYEDVVLRIVRTRG